jgi:enterobactin synthetase component D
MTDMMIADAFQDRAAGDETPRPIWPWEDERRDCHFFTLRYGFHEGCAGETFSLPEQLCRASPRRKAEFVAGRRCAVAAIRDLIGSDLSPGVGEDRAPIWPEGVVGAISHSHGRAIALAGYSHRFCGIGVDIERLLTGDAARDIALQALTPRERQSLGSAVDPFMVSLIFSAKESLFKALYPSVRRFFPFEAAELSACQEAGSISLRLTTNLSDRWQSGAIIPFRFCIFDDFVMTRVLIEQ